MQGQQPLSVERLSGEGVELFGRTAARLTASFELPFAQHVHQLNAGEGGLRGVERLESSHRPGHAFYGAMVLLHNVIEILDLADLDGRPVLLIIRLDGRFVGRTPVHGDFLRHPTMPTDCFDQEGLGRVLVAVLGE
jgi:hypothetical protein